ncbi:hypothetical protein [uncultured Pseudoalteromonas sp.]|uniref:hypothetical protein n=1 Tax=uncultured Pseudoalteromonas sp. TaxID=114053 RepID=UPI0025978BC0|nr:hypothetical protein [uncultured Pseudoalteromonas sp.]
MQIKQYAPLEIARSFALRHNLTTIQMWLDASEQDGWPEIMPKRPTNTYGCKWSDILAPKTSLNSKFLSYAEAAFTIKQYNLQTMMEFRLFGRQGKRPSNIPSNPERHYKDEWKGWPHFLTGIEK